MSVFTVPVDDGSAWPSLGGLVCRWIEDNLVHGPGQVAGEPARLDPMKRGIVWRAYEVHPKGHPQEGRRRFKRVVFSARKGTAKTELAAWLCLAELHPDAPVRFDGWNDDGSPRGRGVLEPYIPLLATTEEQSEALTYEAVRSIAKMSELDCFEAHYSKIVRTDGRGYAEAVTASPSARDGARTTWQCFDETHRLIQPRLKQAHDVMLANIPKQKLADGWSFTTTTAYAPGEESVAEDDREYAEMVAAGEVNDESLFYFHREAEDGHKLRRPHEVKDKSESDEEEVRRAIHEASGDAIWEWTDVEGIISLWKNPKFPLEYFERVWLNRRVRSVSQVFDMSVVKGQYLARETPWPRKRTEITIGFDGSRTQDATALVGTELETGYQFMIACWQKPHNAKEGWEVPGPEVEEYVRDAFQRWKVVRMVADHNFWQTYVDKWAGLWPKKVVVWQTTALKKTAYAIKGYVDAWAMGEVWHDGDPTYLNHLANARKRELTYVDDDGSPLYLMEKDGSDSSKKIDAAYAAMLSWEARQLAVSGGALRRAGSKAGRTQVYV